MKLITILLFSILLYGCNDSNYKNITPIDSVINITESTKLNKNYNNTQFIITGSNIEFDLNNYTITNYSNNPTIVVTNKSNNITIKQGHLHSNSLSTGIHINACVNENDAKQLAINGVKYENELYKKCSNNIYIHAIKFSYLKTSIYVANYVNNVFIYNNVFSNNDRMAIYLDAGSKLSTIKTNIFFNNGFREVENSGRRRGHISIDSSINNTIENNKFTDTKIKRAYVNYNDKDYLVPVIELYRNCGEPTPNWNTILPRVHGADNNTITNNEFNTRGLGIWFKYREHDQLSSCVAKYPDKSDNNTASGNSFSGTSIYDDGINNKW